jgi:glutamate racemase
VSRNAGRDLPIGVFDSGIGGLTVVREIMRQMPGEKVVYFGDTARTPYGTKSPETLVRFSVENARFLIRKKIKMLVVACNSSSAYCLPALRKELGIPVVGVIEPGARAAVGARKAQRIGVIGTQATIRSGAYQAAIQALQPKVKVVTQACPLFVPLVEEGWLESSVTRQVARDYLLPLKAKGIDTLVLGCTHYPLIKGVIRKVLGNGIDLVDSAQETATEVRELLEAYGMQCRRARARKEAQRYFVSDTPERFSSVGKRFLGASMGPVKMVHPLELAGGERRQGKARI